MADRYILDNRKAVPCGDLMTWARWFETANRSVADTRVGSDRVSTVFLAVDHSFGDGSPPQLFETMIFGGEHDDHQRRCATWEQAEAQHAQAVAMLTNAAEHGATHG